MTRQALKLLDEAYQNNQPDLANKARALISYYKLPMSEEQQASYDQLCNHLDGTVDEKRKASRKAGEDTVATSALLTEAKNKREPAKALEILGGWFVDTNSKTLLLQPLQMLAKMEKTSEDELVSEYCWAVVQIVLKQNNANDRSMAQPQEAGNTTSTDIDLSAQKAILLSMEKHPQFANNTALGEALAQLEKFGVQ